ncbi:nucleoside hydrolase [Companilactobacillus sp. HBUAS59544]|uniref:nucleoside hydrolase n=1 Tax=Companilactobacillus sp. HBUAS59544 TaxID=3109363 RepID=UPI002FF43A62
MPNQKVRVIICSDVGNEADDQFAIVQALLTKRIVVKGMVAGFFNEANSVEKAFKKMVAISKLTNMDFPIKKGASSPGWKLTKGAQLLIEESLKRSTLPLYIVCLGGLTDLATAIAENPKIVQKIHVIWVGGGRYPSGSHEANVARYIEAANFVMKSGCDIWQIPSNAYKEMRVSTSFLKLELSNSGEVSKFLYNEILEFEKNHYQDKPWINDESWVLGDSAAIGVLLDEQKGNYSMVDTPIFGDDFKYRFEKGSKKIRVYHHIDRDLILMDLISKLKLFEHC